MKKRIFSGAQPTGNLHIGNYLGTLTGVALQTVRGVSASIYTRRLCRKTGILKQKPG